MVSAAVGVRASSLRSRGTVSAQTLSILARRARSGALRCDRRRAGSSVAPGGRCRMAGGSIELASNLSS
jgi:hypothetical protein